MLKFLDLVLIGFAGVLVCMSSYAQTIPETAYVDRNAENRQAPHLNRESPPNEQTRSQDKEKSPATTNATFTNSVLPGNAIESNGDQ